jgi:hypothetical protein
LTRSSYHAEQVRALMNLYPRESWDGAVIAEKLVLGG